MTASVVALRGFVVWTLALLVVMEAVRTVQFVTGKVPANQFVPDNGNLSPFCSGWHGHISTASRACRCSAACWRSRS